MTAPASALRGQTRPRRRQRQEGVLAERDVLQAFRLRAPAVASDSDTPVGPTGILPWSYRTRGWSRRVQEVRAGRVFVTGASRLPAEDEALARELGQRLMTETTWTLITGGLRKRRTSSHLALDGVVAEAAFDALGRSLASSQSRIVTMLPEAQHEDLERFEIGSVIRARYSTARTRRYSMVLTSDAVVAVNGGSATKQVLELGYAAERPLVPLLAAGGTAAEVWEDYRGDLLLRARADERDERGLRDRAIAVATCLSVLRRVLRPRCFVAMRFTDHPVANAFETIRAVGEDLGFQIVRIDQENVAGSIVDGIWDSIRQSDVAIVDLTDHRPNVYYELGICHALGKPCVMTVYNRDGRVPDDIPFDIRARQVRAYGTTDSLATQLREAIPGAVGR